MSKKRWFRFYIERWRDGTFGLTPNEVTAYITVLCELYDHEGMCVLDNDLLARRCSMRPSSFQKAIEVLVARRKLVLEGEFVTAKSVSEEIKSREKVGEKSVKSQIKGVEKRNENNGISVKLNCIKEERIKKDTFLEGSALYQKEGALEESRKRSAAALAGFLKRQEVRRR